MGELPESADAAALPPPSYYDLLNVSEEVSEEELLTTTVELLRDEARPPLQRLQATFAWEALADPGWRRAYDRSREEGFNGPRDLPLLRLRPLDPAASILESAPTPALTALLTGTAFAPPPLSVSDDAPEASVTSSEIVPAAPRGVSGVEERADISAAAPSRRNALGGDTAPALLRVLLPRLCTIYVAVALVLVLRYAHDVFPLAPGLLAPAGPASLVAAFALGTALWLALELPILAQWPWRLRAALWGGGLCALLSAAAPWWGVLLAAAGGAALGEGLRSWLQLVPHAGSPARKQGAALSGPEAAPAAAGVDADADADSPDADSPDPEPSGAAAPDPATPPPPAPRSLPRSWPAETRFGVAWGAPEEVIRPLRDQLSLFGIDPQPATTLDAVAGAIATDAWMFCTGATTIRSAAQYGPAHLAALSAALTRAGGLASSEVVAPFEAPATSVLLGLALRGWVAWACAQLSCEDAARALRLAATDLSCGSGFGDELSQVASAVFTAAEELERFPHLTS